MKDLQGNEIDFSKFADHPIMVINVASKCGLTKSNVKWLKEVNQKHKNLQILAVPSRDFNQQEFDQADKIEQFIKENDIHYQYLELSKVNGTQTGELYTFLRSYIDYQQVQWNFSKFIFDKKGNFVSYYDPKVEFEVIDQKINEII